MKNLKKINSYIKKAQIVALLLIIFSNAFCQVASKSDLTNVSLENKKDTLLIEGNDFVLYHYHFLPKTLQKREIAENPENIFNDSLNDYSRLIFKSLRNGNFNVPSVPLSQIIFLKEPGIIIGLSKIESSPYHIVIYSLKGELLSKRILDVVELKFTKLELKDLFEKHPKLIDCLAKNVIVQNNNDYYLEPSNCLLTTIGKDSLFKMNRFVSNHYFPLMGISMDTRLPKYHSSFSDSDPLYDLIMIGSVPYLLVLNSEDGRKVNIPLLSSFRLDDFK